MLHMTMVPLVEQVRQRLEEARVELQARHPQTTWLIGKGTLGTDFGSDELSEKPWAGRLNKTAQNDSHESGAFAIRT